ncbi:MAG: hypothetical protein GY830_03925 [Bacteroidetes bacterium]|nr:hypothetical protein [Bacteroidota bacterium]
MRLFIPLNKSKNRYSRFFILSYLFVISIYCQKKEISNDSDTITKNTDIKEKDNLKTQEKIRNTKKNEASGPFLKFFERNERRYDRIKRVKDRIRKLKERGKTVTTIFEDREKIEAKEKKAQAAKKKRLENNEHPYEAAARIHHHSFKRKFKKNENKDTDDPEEDNDQSDEDDDDDEKENNEERLEEGDCD